MPAAGPDDPERQGGDREAPPRRIGRPGQGEWDARGQLGGAARQAMSGWRTAAAVADTCVFTKM